MIYPENATLVPKVIGWINDGLTRATAQVQEPYIGVKEVRNPMLDDPWALPQVTWVIDLPDAYIMVAFPANADEYDAPNDRLSMASEAATQTTYSLTSLTYKTRQTDDDFAASLLKFYQQLYTWNTDAITFLKVHPEDIVRNVLFNQPAPTFAARTANVGYVDPNLFLLGSKYYDATALVANLAQYANLESNAFLWKTQSVSFCYPGWGYTWDDSLSANRAMALALGISFSVSGFLLNTFTAAQMTQFLNQNWQARSDILASGAIYGNVYFSYLIRQIINS